MPANGQMHWHEGLFLQPHHLQYMQRNLLEKFGSDRRISMCYPYGVIESRLSPDGLENMLVQFDRLRVMMPSGIEVDFPGNADLPALDIKRAYEGSSGSFTISLGVPLWYDSRGNTIETPADDDWRVKRIYRVAEQESADENTGDNPQPMLVRRINARLLLPDQDPSDLETIPLLRIARATGEQVGLPRQDPNFIPPCLVLTGSPVLFEMVRDLANQVEASRSELVIQMTRGGFSVDQMRGVQFEQMLRLKTLNRFAGRLPAMVAAPHITPFALYLELRDLLGELSALTPDRDQFNAPAYDHDNTSAPFAEIISKIRSMLRGAVAPSFIQVKFEMEGRALVAKFTTEHFTRPSDYFLGVKTKEDPRAVAKLVEDADKFKLMATSMIAQRVWGIRLQEERHPPLELPSQSGLNYYRLDRAESGRMWERIQKESTAAIRFPGMETADYEISLYMTVSGGEG